MPNHRFQLGRKTIGGWQLFGLRLVDFAYSKYADGLRCKLLSSVHSLIDLQSNIMQDTSVVN